MVSHGPCSYNKDLLYTTGASHIKSIRYKYFEQICHVLIIWACLGFLMFQVVLNMPD